MTFSGDDCVFSSESATITIARTNITDFHFETATTDIDKLRNNETLLRIVGKGVVQLFNVPSSVVHVYDLQGKMVKAAITTDGQNTTVSLEQLPEGVYIISYSGSTVKIKQ